MALISRTTSRVPSSTSEPRAEGCKSLGLKALFEVLDPNRKYSFLDLGPVLGPNIEFLSRYASKIRVENLYWTLAGQQFFERGDECVDETAFDRMLSPPSHERFEIILSWDVLNYFRPEEVRVLVRYLERLCLPGSFFFAIISTLKEMPVVPMSFRILDTETLLYTTDSAETRPCRRYAPRDLGLLMSGFQAHSSYMLRNGMQEYLFVRN